MNNIKIVNKCILLLMPIKVKINDTSFKIKINNAQSITLPNGQYKLTVWYGIIIKHTTITVEDKDMEIVINRMFPELVIGLGAGIMITLYTLLFLSVINFFIAAGAFLVYVVLKIHYELRPEKYFKIKIHQK